jgi:CheY-like chemotaxis protein
MSNPQPAVTRAPYEGSDLRLSRVVGTPYALHRGHLAKKRILFIDDRPEHLRQPVLRLQLAGYEVEEATSGAAGLARLREEPFDLLILDADLPTEDGWGVLKEVRADPSLAEVKAVVFMAAKGETQKLMLVPVDAELRRPFSMGALLDAVGRVIGEP